eukprot:g3713.t1
MSEVHQSEEFWIVQFCHGIDEEDKCPLREDVEDVARELDVYNIRFGRVNCKEHMQICGRENLARLPTVKYYNEPPQMNPYTKKPYRTSKTFFRKPAASALKKLAAKHMPNYVRLVETIDDFEKMSTDAYGEQRSVAMFISTKRKISPLIKMIALEFRDRLDVAQIEERNVAEIVTSFDEEEGDYVAPALVVTKADGSVIRYDGKLSKNHASDIVEFLRPHAPERSASSSELVAVGGAASLTSSDFASKVLNDPQDGTWIVVFGTENTVDEEEIAEAVATAQSAGLVYVGFVDCEVESTLCEEQGVVDSSKMPLVVSFAKRDGSDEAGRKRKKHGRRLRDAVDVAIKSTPDRTTPMMDSLFNQHLTNDMQTQKVTVLLLTKSRNIPASIRSASHLFRDTLSINVISNPSKQFLTEMQLDRQMKKMPFMCAMLPIPVESSESDMAAGKQNVQIQMVPFGGSFDFDDVFQYTKELSQKVLPQLYPDRRTTSSSRRKGTAGESSSSSDDEAAFQGGTAKAFAELTAKNQKDACKKPCVVAFLNGNDGESDIAAQVDTLKRVYERKKSQFDFYWINGRCQHEVAATFGVDEYSMPGVAVWSKSKGENGVFVRMLGSYSEDSIAAFLRGVRRGSHASSALSTTVPRLLDAETCDAAEKATATDIDEVVIDDDDIDIAELLADIAKEEQAREEEIAEATDAGGVEDDVDPEWQARLDALNKASKPKRKRRKKKKKKKKKKKSEL